MWPNLVSKAGPVWHSGTKSVKDWELVHTIEVISTIWGSEVRESRIPKREMIAGSPGLRKSVPRSFELWLYTSLLLQFVYVQLRIHSPFALRFWPRIDPMKAFERARILMRSVLFQGSLPLRWGHFFVSIGQWAPANKLRPIWLLLHVIHGFGLLFSETLPFAVFPPQPFPERCLFQPQARLGWSLTVLSGHWKSALLVWTLSLFCLSMHHFVTHPFSLASRLAYRQLACLICLFFFAPMLRRSWRYGQSLGPVMVTRMSWGDGLCKKQQGRQQNQNPKPTKKHTKRRQQSIFS